MTLPLPVEAHSHPADRNIRFDQKKLQLAVVMKNSSGVYKMSERNLYKFEVLRNS